MANHESRIESKNHHFAESMIRCPNHMIRLAMIRTQKYYLSLHNPPRAPKNRGRYPEISAEKLPGAVGFRQKSPNFLSLSPASLGLNPGITRIHQMYLKIRVGGGFLAHLLKSC